MIHPILLSQHRSRHRARRRRSTGLLLGLLASIACASDPASVATTGTHLVRDVAAKTADGLIQVVIEIPAGTNAKWEVVKKSGELEWETRNGKPRVVDYVAYPGNYGMVPRTLLPRELGGDGDPLDVIVLGPAVDRGSIVAARVIGVLELLDRGERDDKLIAVRPGAPLGDITSLAELNERYAGVSQIVELWFSNYKGPGKMESLGFGEAGRAGEILESAIEAYARSTSGGPKSTD